MGAATRGTRVAWDAGPVATRRGDAVMAAVVAFFIAMPYPGLAIGSNTGLTLGHVFSFLALALAFARRSRVVPLVSWITGLAVLPLLLPVIASDSPVGNLNAAIAFSIHLFALGATVYLFPRAPAAFLGGLVAAITVHALVGFLQMSGFDRGELVGEALLVNPSFASFEATRDVYVQYVRRPFGLFPEPSAAAASLGPWVVLLLAGATGHSLPALGRLQGRARWLCAAAAAAAIWLIIAGESGGFISAALGTTVLLLGLAINRLRRGGLLTAFIVPVVILAGLFLAFDFILSARGVQTLAFNASWVDRLNSIVAGSDVLSDRPFMGLLFGIGLFDSQMAVAFVSGATGIHSASVSYLLGSGVLGALIVCLAMVWSVKPWQPNWVRVAFGIALWTSLTAVSGYYALLMLWSALGLALVWPHRQDRAPLPQTERRAFRVQSR
ncbi:MAG: hypothetical protein ACK52I_07865 [Pseudomonadota bacterium]|jgi:hypothetical protein